MWIVSGVFGSHENSTGSLLTQLADGLGARYRVRIVTSPAPAAAAGGEFAPIVRRLVHGIVESVRLGWRLLRSVQRGDVVLGATNPPVLPLVLTLLRALRGFKLIVLMHDLYPDALYAANLPAGKWLPRLFDRLNAFSLRQSDRVIVIGRDMQRRVQAKLRTPADHVAFIPNWPDIEPVANGARTNSGDLVVQYSGKLGVTHDPDLIAQTAAILLHAASPARLEVRSWGAQTNVLQERIRTDGLTNIVLLGPCPRSELGRHLADCDVGLIVMREGMDGVSVPCRFYNLLAAGRPVIAAVAPDSEIGIVITEARLGWVTRPGDPEALAQAIRSAAANRGALVEMGRRALSLAQERYSFQHALRSYETVIDTCFAAG